MRFPNYFKEISRFCINFDNRNDVLNIKSNNARIKNDRGHTDRNNDTATIRVTVVQDLLELNDLTLYKYLKLCEGRLTTITG